MIEIPGYEIKREIDANNLATVYLALQASLDREVALKVMAPSLAEDPAFAQRFMQEARTLASLAHPHVIAVYDVGVAPGNRYYFAMQYLPGGDFMARVQRGIDDAALFETLDGVTQALDYVHQRGLIHRDVTPRNILYDVSGMPILTDFGIARAIGASAGSTGTDYSAVTGHYISPEQARGTPLDARADLYSLGALTYFGLTGKPPYDGVDGFAVAYAHVFEPIPRLPPERAHWQALIDRALAKEPSERFASAREFLDALNKLMQGRSGMTEAAVPQPQSSASAQLEITDPVPAPGIEAEKPAASPPPAAYPTMMHPVPQTAASAPQITPPAGASTTPRPARARWPLFAVAAVVAAIGIVSYTQFGRHATVEKGPLRVQATPPAGAGAQPAPSTNMVVNPDAATKSASTDATAIPSLDAAAEAAVGEFVPVTDVFALPTVVDPVTEAIRLGRIDFASQRLTTPPGMNALERFQFALKRDPKNKTAKLAILDIAKKYIQLADKAQAGSDTSAYLQLLTNADDVAKTLDEAADVRQDVATRRAKVAEPYLAQAKGAVAELDKVTAKTAYEKVLEIDPNNAAAHDGLKLVATMGEPGFVFHDKLGDGSQGPDMLILGGGKTAVARHDVTRGEFRRYWNAAGRAAFAGKEPGCRDRESFFRSSRDRTWQSPGFDQDDSHPVVCVNWAEAAAYAQWLSHESGKRYRLLSVAEFDQLAARAASDCKAANLADAAFNRKYESHDGASCDDGFAETAPAAHFESGGVHDASGNVRVWVAACGNGAAVPAGGVCRDYLAKGRSWMSAPRDVATSGDSFGADVGLNSVGFRLAREIDK